MCRGSLLPSIAQRRPERQPRRHPEPSPAQRVAGLRSTKAGASTPATPGLRALQVWLVPNRSTKAGASTPATLVNGTHELRVVLPAQRRPERQPRRHIDGCVRSVRSSLRSTKAGASTPATLQRGTAHPLRLLSLNEGRSVNPGDTRVSYYNEGAPIALNEGRSVNPGDTAKFCKRAVSGQTIARPRAREPRRRRVCGHFTRFRTIPRQNGQDPAIETALTAAEHTRFPRITEGSQMSQSTQGWPSS